MTPFDTHPAGVFPAGLQDRKIMPSPLEIIGARKAFRTTFLIRIKTISNFLVGISPSGKAPGFDPGIPRFKSW